MLITGFVSLVFQKLTEKEHWGHRLKANKYRRYYWYCQYFKLKNIRFRIDLNNVYRPITNTQITNYIMKLFHTLTIKKLHEKDYCCNIYIWLIQTFTKSAHNWEVKSEVFETAASDRTFCSPDAILITEKTVSKHRHHGWHSPCIASSASVSWSLNHITHNYFMAVRSIMTYKQRRRGLQKFSAGRKIFSL